MPACFFLRFPFLPGSAGILPAVFCGLPARRKPFPHPESTPLSEPPRSHSPLIRGKRASAGGSRAVRARPHPARLFFSISWARRHPACLFFPWECRHLARCFLFPGSAGILPAVFSFLGVQASCLLFSLSWECGHLARCFLRASHPQKTLPSSAGYRKAAGWVPGPPISFLLLGAQASCLPFLPLRAGSPHSQGRSPVLLLILLFSSPWKAARPPREAA